MRSAYVIMNFDRAQFNRYQTKVFLAVDEIAAESALAHHTVTSTTN